MIITHRQPETVLERESARLAEKINPHGAKLHDCAFEGVPDYVRIFFKAKMCNNDPLVMLCEHSRGERKATAYCTDGTLYCVEY